MPQLLHVSECCFAPAYFLNSEYIHNAYEAWAKTKKPQHSNYNYNNTNNNNTTYIPASLKSALRASRKGLSNPGGNLNK